MVNFKLHDKLSRDKQQRNMDKNHFLKRIVRIEYGVYIQDTITQQKNQTIRNFHEYFLFFLLRVYFKRIKKQLTARQDFRSDR